MSYQSSDNRSLNRLQQSATVVFSTGSIFTRKKLYGFVLIILASLTACATPVGEVERWGISGVEVAEISGEVVDVLCEVSGNCVEQCGAGTRQIGIKTQQSTVLVAKDLNRYTGAAEELWPFCSQQLVVNGQYTETGAIRFFQVQNVRLPQGKWMSTSRFLEVWAEQNGKSLDAANRWYLEDQRVETILTRDGLLGLGPEPQ